MKENIKLNLLLDMLKEKEEQLQIISNITQNQETIIKSNNKSTETLSLFKALSKEKQLVIDKVLSIDTAFSSNYSSIEHIFTLQSIPDDLKPIIKEMQTSISTIDLLTNEIKRREKENDVNIEQLKFVSNVNNSIVANKKLKDLYKQ